MHKKKKKTDIFFCFSAVVQTGTGNHDSSLCVGTWVSLLVFFLIQCHSTSLFSSSHRNHHPKLQAKQGPPFIHPHKISQNNNLLFADFISFNDCPLFPSSPLQLNLLSLKNDPLLTSSHLSLSFFFL